MYLMVSLCFISSHLILSIAFHTTTVAFQTHSIPIPKVSSVQPAIHAPKHIPHLHPPQVSIRTSPPIPHPPKSHPKNPHPSPHQSLIPWQTILDPIRKLLENRPWPPFPLMHTSPFPTLSLRHVPLFLFFSASASASTFAFTGTFMLASAFVLVLVLVFMFVLPVGSVPATMTREPLESAQEIALMDQTFDF